MCLCRQPDSTCVAGDERLHPIGAGLPHFIRTMAVKIQRKRGCCVPQVFLYSLDIVPGAERVDRISVPEVMNSDVRHIEAPDDLFEAVIQRPK